MNFAKNYENLLNFVPKILVIPFFRTWCTLIAVAAVNNKSDNILSTTSY